MSRCVLLGAEKVQRHLRLIANDPAVVRRHVKQIALRKESPSSKATVAVPPARTSPTVPFKQRVANHRNVAAKITRRSLRLTQLPAIRIANFATGPHRGGVESGAFRTTDTRSLFIPPPTIANLHKNLRNINYRFHSLAV